MAISFVSLSARSCRPPLANCSTDSRRCFTSVCKTCSASASSSGRTFSISLYLSADLTMRSTLRRNSSLDIIAAVKSFWIRSINAILVCANEGSRLSRLYESDPRCGEFQFHGVHYSTEAKLRRPQPVGFDGVRLFVPGTKVHRLKPAPLQPGRRSAGALGPDGELCYS